MSEGTEHDWTCTSSCGRSSTTPKTKRLTALATKVTVIMHKDGSIEVQDEGRGLPVDIHEQTHMPAVQLDFYDACTAGGKFNSKTYATSSWSSRRRRDRHERS
jgi:hypothetical protein